MIVPHIKFTALTMSDSLKVMMATHHPRLLILSATKLSTIPGMTNHFSISYPRMTIAMTNHLLIQIHLLLTHLMKLSMRQTRIKYHHPIPCPDVYPTYLSPPRRTQTVDQPPLEQPQLFKNLERVLLKPRRHDGDAEQPR